ncbi:MAG TPA: DUF3365 domain-containing protein [Opitutaceae bacterium]|nr:DUF3365 domain-containing protein [Opitutaceae bacterium]HND59860.1 DUF3365 domain-containing protein [Opitutaceae bacterium]
MKTSRCLLFVAAAALPFLTRAAEPAVATRFVPVDDPAVTEIRQIGDKALTRLGVELQREVGNAMAKDGAEAAVEICHLKSLKVVNGALAGMPRVTAFKLTSLKLRNPANAPDAVDQQALDAIKQQMENGDAPAALMIQRVEPANGTPEWRLYKPLGVTPKCASCHGDPAEMPPGLKTKLEINYPSDKANGYVPGEWRGVIRVTVADAAAK